MIAYPETEQFRTLVQKITNYPYRYKREQNQAFPVLEFTGTVKIHGTNAAIVYQKDSGYRCQSRNNIITPAMDNAEFALRMYSLAEDFLTKRILSDCPIVRKHYERGAQIIIYGEWCGGNIQKNTAVTGLPKKFVIFKVRVGDSKPPVWLNPQDWSNLRWHEMSIYNIYDFPTYEMKIDFNQPRVYLAKLSEITEEVERSCPVGAYFNRNGIGEGVVWTEWKQSSGILAFKVKGRAHSVSNVKQVASIETENFGNIYEFVEYACTENRMYQALEYLCEQNLDIVMDNFQVFLEWLVADIVKEETDVMNSSNINAKDINDVIVLKARLWFEEVLM